MTTGNWFHFASVIFGVLGLALVWVDLRNDDFAFSERFSYVIIPILWVVNVSTLIIGFVV